MDFNRYIKELLLQQDCVILPGLGGFVANYKPAEFDQARRTASPPSKHILFNRNLVHNDGLLYAHVSKISGYGYKEVQAKAEAFIGGIQKDTGRGIKFEIEGLGYFFQDKEGQLQFTEETGNNFLLESYGLPYLQYREIEKPGIATYLASSAETDPLLRQRRIRRWAYGTAAACVLAALVIVPVRNGYFNQAGIDSPFVRKIEKQEQVPSQASLIPSITPSISHFQAPPEFNIVVGSFKDFGHAREYRSRVIAKGYPARILCFGENSYRVTAGTFREQEEARVELAFVLSDFDDAWVLSN